MAALLRRNPFIGCAGGGIFFAAIGTTFKVLATQRRCYEKL
jgi:hypothetical protein